MRAKPSRRSEIACAIAFHTAWSTAASRVMATTARGSGVTAAAYGVCSALSVLLSGRATHGGGARGRRGRRRAAGRAAVGAAAATDLLPLDGARAACRAGAAGGPGRHAPHVRRAGAGRLVGAAALRRPEGHRARRERQRGR